jgi:Flp pilus assembly protein TadG
MNKPHAAGCRSGRGQSLVEAAIVVPLLLLLFAGVVELGRAFYDYIVITNAAREGARYGSLYPHYCTGIQNAVKNEAALGHMNMDSCTITITPNACAGVVAAPGTPIRVEVACPYQTVVGNLLGLSQPLTELRNAATMVVFGLD